SGQRRGKLMPTPLPLRAFSGWSRSRRRVPKRAFPKWTYQIRGTGGGLFQGFPRISGEVEMRGPRYDRILAGTALALVLTLGPSAYAQPDLLEANMPLPEQSALPPPTAADVTSTPGNAPTTSNAPATQVTPSESAAPRKTPDPQAYP